MTSTQDCFWLPLPELTKVCNTNWVRLNANKWGMKKIDGDYDIDYSARYGIVLLSFFLPLIVILVCGCIA